MNVGVGLPNTTPGTDGALVLEWARRADAGPFSSVAVLDRVAYDGLEPFATLAAAAAATTRVRLATMIAIAPLRPTALLAKQAASVHALSGGRLTLGLAIGARIEDYDVAGVEHRGRGRKLSEQLAYIRGGVDEDRVGPSREGIELLVGGASGPAFARVARYADGYAHGGGPPRAFAGAAARAEAAWRDLGRPGARGSGARATSLSGTSSAATPTSATTTRSRALRRADRRRQPDQRAGDQGLRARLRGSGLRRARPPPHDRRPRGARPPRRGGVGMRVAIVGGGPAGLYLAILLKKADRDVDVSVFERNAPDATFGWGVVFSEETLGSLRDADPETHLAITDTFARWDRVDIRYRGRVLSSQGHSFSAIARKRLLEILQRRCFSLGVDLAFGVEVAEVPGDADLVVGADGVNSIVRRATSASSARPSSRRAASTSGSGPTSSSTPSRSSSARPSTGSSRCTPTRSTSARARSSSSAPRRPGAGPASTSSTRTRASRSASGCSPATSRATSCSRTARSGSTSRRS